MRGLHRCSATRSWTRWRPARPDRHTTEHNLSGQKTPCSIGYAAVLMAMIGAGDRSSCPLVGFDVSKDRVLYRENAEGRIENVYKPEGHEQGPATIPTVSRPAACRTSSCKAGERRTADRDHRPDSTEHHAQHLHQKYLSRASAIALQSTSRWRWLRRKIAVRPCVRRWARLRGAAALRGAGAHAGGGQRLAPAALADFANTYAEACWSTLDACAAAIRN